MMNKNYFEIMGKHVLNEKKIPVTSLSKKITVLYFSWKSIKLRVRRLAPCLGSATDWFHALASDFPLGLDLFYL